MSEELQKYYTPDWAVRGLFEFLPEVFPTFETMLKYEPFVGDGAISRFFDKPWECITNDIDPDVPADHRINMREDSSWEKLAGLIRIPKANKIIITNPPFKDCQYFVRNALEHFDNVVMMLRLSWLEPTLIRRDLPLSRHVLITERIQFQGKGKDSVTTAWFIWNKDQHQKSIIRHLLKP